MSRRIKRASIINAIIALFFLVSVVLPIFSMLRRITPDGFREMLRFPMFGQAVRNSLITSLISTVVSLLLAFCAAWCVQRILTKRKALVSVILTVPMLIPSISHAFGLVALFGSNGMLTRLFNLSGSIYGFPGILVGSVLYSFPVAFLMFSNILSYEDGMTHKAAQVLGIPPWYRFLDITLPFLRKTIISAFFTVFTMIITDYGVPLMVGGKTITLSVLMYNRAVGMIDYDGGSVIGAFLLIPAIAAFAVDLLNPENDQNGFVPETVESQGNRFQKAGAYFFCGIVCVFVLSPVAALGAMVCETKYPVDPTFTLYHIQKTISRGADGYLVNSLMYAFLTAAAGTLLAFLCAYMTARAKGKFHGGLHLMAMVSMAIPGLVLGLSYVIFYHDTPIYGTVMIVLLVNTVHFFASPYLMIYNTLGKLNPNIEAVARSLGVSVLAVIRDVILPKVRYTLMEMFSYFFVNSMMTISAVSYLAPPAPKPVALMINQFEAQLLMESAAFVSIMILAVNLVVKGVIYVLGRIYR